MQRFLVDLGKQRRYWALLILVGLALEGGALFFQYVLDEYPCVLCIQVRMLVIAFVLLAMVAIFYTDSVGAMRFFHGINSLLMGWLVERSWQVLGVERGWVFGDCGMDLGLPEWFALDKWLPEIFEVQTSCGYTPLIVFDITMGECLLLISIALLIMSAALFVTSWQD